MGLLAAFVLGSAAPSPCPAQFQELFTWGRRQLLPLSLEPGGWARLERYEAAAGEVLSDTLTCRVLEVSSDESCWIEVRASRTDSAWILQVEPNALAAQDSDLFEALLGLYHVDAEGEVWREDVEELEASRMVRRHLEDLFDDPKIERDALPDSAVAGQTVLRERVTLSEVQEVRAPVGKRVLVHTSDLRSEAILSPSVPVFGLLSAVTRITVESRWESAGETAEPSQRGPPPLYSEIRIRCVDFGWEPPRGLPEILRHDLPR